MNLSSLQRRIVGAAVLACASLIGLAFAQLASAQADAPVYAGESRAQIVESKRLQIADEFRHEQQERREAAERARKHGKKKHGKKAEQAFLDSDFAGVSANRAATPFGIDRVTVTPLNTRANNKTADAAGAGQAEQSIAFLGQYGLCAWNDGQGFNLTPQDVQGYGYTVDGGATWIDGGIPPKTAAITTWTSDPVVGLNEKTGNFYYCGLTSNPGSTNGLAVVRGSFSGSTFTWGTPVMVASGSSTSFAYDKQWMVADSLTGNLYVTYTLFTTTGSAIWFRRSTDGGTTWSAALQISSAADNGNVQGSRPCVGPNGEVYVVYYAISSSTNYDFMKVRKSTDAGATFSAEVVAANVYTNFGTGAPGFNRSRGIDMPSIAVDRSTGPNRGRVYVGYHETIDWYSDPLGGGGNKNEVENNASFANATLFTVGQTLRGQQTAATDVDNYKFSAVQGTTYVFWVDSLQATTSGPAYTLRVYCPNDTVAVSRLSLGGDATNRGRYAYIVWTAPTTSTYYLRWAGALGASKNYRIRTGTHTVTAGDHLARDQRDAMIASSADGITWGAGVRMNDDSPWFDNWLPEVAVGCDGNVYGMWLDFRDAASSCGGGSNTFVTRSTNGGASFAANQTVSSAITANWTQVSSNIAPNQGDYNGFYAGDALGFAWADGRLADSDVYTARVALGYALDGCVPSQTIVAGSTLSTGLGITNLNGMFSNTYNYSVSVNRSWPGFPATGTVSLGSLGAGTVPVSVSVPDSAAHNEVVQVCITVSLNGACVKRCCFDLTVNNIVTPTLASLASSTAEPGRVSLRWLVDMHTTVNAYRSEDGANWDAIGSYSPDADGYVNVVDTDVRAGARYAYRLGILQGGREIYAGQSWVSVPAGAEFAIDRTFPSPAKAGFSVSFSLPSAAPATLEVLDLAGRRVLSRQVGTMGAGRHTLSLEAETGRLPVGVYAVRLSQAGRVTSAKVSVIR